MIENNRQEIREYNSLAEQIKSCRTYDGLLSNLTKYQIVKISTIMAISLDKAGVPLQDVDGYIIHKHYVKIRKNIFEYNGSYFSVYKKIQMPDKISLINRIVNSQRR